MQPKSVGFSLSPLIVAHRIGRLLAVGPSLIILVYSPILEEEVLQSVNLDKKRHHILPSENECLFLISIVL